MRLLVVIVNVIVKELRKREREKSDLLAKGKQKYVHQNQCTVRISAFETHGSEYKKWIRIGVHKMEGWRLALVAGESSTKTGPGPKVQKKKKKP